MVNGTDHVLTGWGRTAPSRAYVTGPLDEWRAVRERLDPRGVFCSDLGRRLGLC
jgi:hypothetical protein